VNELTGGTELVAQASHVRIDRSRPATRGQVPELVQKSATALHAVAPINQGHEEAKLQTRQGDFAPGNEHAVGMFLDSQVSYFDGLRGCAALRACVLREIAQLVENLFAPRGAQKLGQDGERLIHTRVELTIVEG
jgi:hypothetical protein